MEKSMGARKTAAPDPAEIVSTTIAALELIPPDIPLRDILHYVRDASIELLVLRVSCGPREIADLALERYERQH